MKRFKKILFINDFKKEMTPALERAVRLAKTNKALITIVEVLEDFPPEIQNIVPANSLKEFQKTVETDSIKGLNNLIAPLQEKGVKIKGDVLRGTPFIEIIGEVLRNNHDLVMISPRKEGKLRTMLFGSRIMHLMRKCPCPIWAIKPTEQKRYNKIMVAVDPLPINEKEGLLNVKIMELATSLAYKEKSELHIISCRKLLPVALMSHHMAIGQDALDEVNLKVMSASRQRMDEILDRFDLLDSIWEKSAVNVDDLSCRVHLLDGEPDDLIPELANRERVDLVVMGTISRVGLPGFLIGNTAEKILQKLNCSVLAVKPDGFKTPVKLQT